MTTLPLRFRNVVEEKSFESHESVGDAVRQWDVDASHDLARLDRGVVVGPPHVQFEGAVHGGHVHPKLRPMPIFRLWRTTVTFV